MSGLAPNRVRVAPNGTNLGHLCPTLKPNITSLVDGAAQGCQIWHPNWVRLDINGRNLGLFKINETKCTETDLQT